MELAYQPDILKFDVHNVVDRIIHENIGAAMSVESPTPIQGL